MSSQNESDSSGKRSRNEDSLYLEKSFSIRLPRESGKKERKENAAAAAAAAAECTIAAKNVTGLKRTKSYSPPRQTTPKHCGLMRSQSDDAANINQSINEKKKKKKVIWPNFIN